MIIVNIHSSSSAAINVLALHFPKQFPAVSSYNSKHQGDQDGIHPYIHNIFLARISIFYVYSNGDRLQV